MVGQNEQAPFPSHPRHEAFPGTHPVPTGRELRKHLRFHMDDSSTSFSMKGVSTSLGAGHVSRGRAAINLSEGGAMLLVCEAIPVGTEVVVRIEIEDHGEFLETAGVVRWCEQANRNEKDFHAGIEFVGLNEADLRKIGKMREACASSGDPSRRATESRG